ncbi:SusC/RagA family TonB-linked outer membrane protein, partial [Bacteroides fragilis]
MQNYFSIQLLRVVKSSLWLTSKKIPRTMRLFILFLICSMSFVHATDSFAQKVEISIDAQNQTVEKVLKEIEKQSGFGFFFNNKHVNLKRVVSVSVDKSNIFKVLDKIFEGTDVKYSVLDKKIILSTEMTSKQQQAVKISGKVVDVNGEPVIGASIVEKGTTNGTVTNLQGDFSLSVSSDKAVIEISYIGYQPQELKVIAGKPLNVTMKEDAQALEEVVVVGYGSQKKVNVIGSIAAVDSKKLESRTAPSVSNMLTGQLSGVTITQSSGNPGQDQGTIRVRGVGSFGATPDPLVLVDGLPGSLNDLNPADIESISILKDASSAAIYGSRAANGVVLVKTKGGQKGKVTVSYNGYVGFNQATELPEMCDSWEYAELYNKA